jgi:hypothetical protein
MERRRNRFLPRASGGKGPPKAAEGASEARGARPLHHASHGPPPPSQTTGEERRRFRLFH